MKKFFTLIAVAAMAFAAQATEWTAADGATTSEYAPVYGYNFETDQHNQMQYPASELTGIAAGTEITAVKFYTSTPSLVNALGGTVTVSLANMDDVTPWTPNAWGGVYGDLLDVAVTAVATVTPAADENGVWTITFDAPFTYTGAALLVDFETINEGTWKDTRFYGKEMGAYYVMSAYGYAGSKKGETVLPKVTFIYEGEGGGQEDALTLLSQANALEDAAQFTFNGDAVVTAAIGSYMFLRDESGFGMIAGVEGTFENGQVLSQGWTATKTSINDGWVRFTDAAGLSANGTNPELAAAIVLTGAVDESMLNAYVCIENQKMGGGLFPGLPPRSFTLPDGTTIGKTEVLGGINWPASGNHNVYGIICKVNGALVFNALSTAPYVEPQPQGLRGDVNNDTFVTIDDVTALISYLLTDDATGLNLENANCNLDETITIDDVTKLISFLLTDEWD